MTGTPGTPGAAGSVNLAGGTLLIDAETSLALNTPYTVMTFGANHLYGAFGQVETEGALGSHTGNSNSVNLGNGDTLEVLYNEATGASSGRAGDDAGRARPTPGTSAAARGTPRVGADWSPPANGSVPSATSAVAIGTGGGGTVTLAETRRSPVCRSPTVTRFPLRPIRSPSNANASVASGAVLTLRGHECRRRVH